MKNLTAKIEWILILIAHLILLAWIWFALHETGNMEMLEITWHFAGMSLYGAGLIFFCAWLGRRRFRQEIEHESKQ